MHYRIGAAHCSSDERWDILLRGFKKSVAHNTGAELDLRHFGYERQKQKWKYNSNSRKLQLWRDIVYDSDLPVVLMDTDTCVLDDISGGFQGEVTLTKPRSRWVNAGVVFIIPNDRTRALMDMWVDRDRQLYQGETRASGIPITLHKAWRQTGVLGQNQTALADMWGEIPCDVAWVDGAVYNCCHKDMFDSEEREAVARVLHIKEHEGDIQKQLMRCVSGGHAKKYHSIISKIIPYYT